MRDVSNYVDKIPYMINPYTQILFLTMLTESVELIEAGILLYVRDMERFRTAIPRAVPTRKIEHW